jgi:hypothetical protein
MMTQQEMKQAVLDALETNDFEAIERLALQSRKVMSVLVRLAYDKETLVGWRAIVAAGQVASAYTGNNYEFLRETVRKLLWSLTDESGGIGWSAPELIGEIVSSDPKRFSDIVPMIAEVFCIEEAVFRPGVLYAFKRIAETHPEMITPFQKIILGGLSEQDPKTRIYAIKLVMMLTRHLGRENLESMKKQVAALTQDEQAAWIYEGDGFSGVVVKEFAAAAMRHLS